MEICTPRLRLRLPRAADAAELARLMTPGISARLASWPPFMVPGTAQTRVEQATAAHAAGLALPLVITRLSDGAVLGWISASRSENNPTQALLTYWIGEAFHGQGIMREAAQPAVAAAFRALGVAELRAAVQTDNTASRAVLRAMGMTPLGPGSIWCAARGREEPCEWWRVERPAADPAALPGMAFLPAFPAVAAAVTG